MNQAVLAAMLNCNPGAWGKRTSCRRGKSSRAQKEWPGRDSAWSSQSAHNSKPLHPGNGARHDGSSLAPTCITEVAKVRETGRSEATKLRRLARAQQVKAGWVAALLAMRWSQAETGGCSAQKRVGYWHSGPLISAVLGASPARKTAPDGNQN